MSIVGLPVLSFLYGALTLIVALSVIVFIHEYGHFKVARLCGFKIDTFSIGFGRKLWGFRDRFGTEWKIGWLPLGGYVKFQGDANAASMPDGGAGTIQPGDFLSRPVWQRALVVAAGPFANFIFAIFLFAAAALISGYPIPGPMIGEVKPGFPAQQAGLLPGDIIRSIAGSEIINFNDIPMAVRTHGGETIALVYERQGVRKEVTLTIAVEVEDHGFLGKNKIGKIGIGPSSASINLEQVGPLRALQLGVEETWDLIALTGQFIGKLFLGSESVGQLGGLGSMASVTSQAATLGFYQFIHTVGFLSVSIGLINLFPIPILDGGHLVFCALEAVRRKPLGAVAQEWALKVGLVVVLALMFIGNWNDVLRAFGRSVGAQ